MVRKIGIVGTRFTELHSPEWEFQIQEFIRSLPDDAEIIVNGAPGTDTVAAESAEERGLKVTVLFPSEHYSNDKRYFIHRNGVVVEQADELHAFWDGVSAGTRHAIALAHRLGVPVHVHPVQTRDWQRVG